MEQDGGMDFLDVKTCKFNTPRWHIEYARLTYLLACETEYKSLNLSNSQLTYLY